MDSPHFGGRAPSQSRVRPDDAGSVLPMKQEINRLVSYRIWPIIFMDPAKLANAGFYYTYEGDGVCCAFCNIVLHRWQEGDDAMEEHKKWSENCPFVQGRDCGNIPITLDSIPRMEGHDVCGTFEFQMMENSLPERETARLTTVKRNVFPHNGGPVYPQYVTMDQRLKSFQNWPSDKKLRPEQLATAGFFYLGFDDKTICFYCRGGLNNWEDDDGAWELHAKWFPKCNFVLMQKGEQFVLEVHRNLNDPVLNNAEVATLEVPSEKTSILKVGEVAATSATVVPTPKEIKTKDLATEDNNKPSDCVALCKICYSNQVGVLFTPCGHTVACVDCALALSSCPFCREPIDATVRAFLC